MGSSRTCRRCGSPLPVLARADALYCSGRCRVAALRARRADPLVAVPLDLRLVGRWVLHERKRPITVAGRPASVICPPTWASYEDARQSAHGDGLGFVLTGDGITCIDLDDCLRNGRLLPWAVRLLSSAPKTYTEVSPSGRGLHVWGRSNLAINRILQIPGGRIEVYVDRRFLTVTGNRFDDSPSELADLGMFVSSLGL